MTTPIRATFLTAMPSPYMRDLFRAMRDDGRIDPQVLYLETALPGTLWDAPVLEDHEQVLEGRGFNVLGGRVHWNPAIQSVLRDSSADIHVIGGYSSLTSQLAASWLRRRKLPWVFFGERPGIQSRRLAGRMMRGVAISAMLRSANAVAAVGSSAVSAYQLRCLSTTRVRNIPYFTDIAPFLAAQSRSNRHDGPVRILYCGQLIERKGVDVLIRAFGRAASRDPSMVLDLVGEGAMRDRLRELVPSKLKDRVNFYGFSAIDDLPQFFNCAHVFVLPSRHDGWGVVINQALAAGLPIIASDAVGAAQDFVANRGTGLIVPAGDESALADALMRIASDQSERENYACRAREMAADLSLERGVEQWVSLLRETLADPRPNAILAR